MRRVVVTATVLLATGSLVLPSHAAPKKPITKTYTATAAPNGVGVAVYCSGLPTFHDKHREPFTAPANGTLKVKMTSETGDWDALLINDANERLAESANTGTSDESYSYKIKKGAAVTLLSCNSLGAPTATVTYTFTFAK